MRPETSLLSVLVSVFKTFSCLFILIVLPLSFLYYLDSYLLLFTKQHVLDTAMMAMIFTLLAFLGAMLAGVIYLIASLFLKKETVSKVIIVYSLGAVAIAVYEFIKTAKLWAVKVFPGAGSKIVIVDIVIVVSFIALVIYIYLFRDKMLPRIKEERDRWFKAVLVLVGVSVILFIGQVSYIYWFDAPENKATKKSVAARSENPRPNVILITFDTLTAEDMSLHGYKLKTTPNIDAFARESHNFKYMYANANWTRPTVASILTGTYPSTHRMIHYGMQSCFLPEKLSNKNIAAVLKSNGYHTAAIVSNLEYAHPSANDTLRNFDYAPLNTINAEYKKYMAPTLIPKALILFFLKIRSTVHIWFSNLTSTYFGFYKGVSYPLEQTKWNTESGTPPEITFDLAYRYLHDVKGPVFLWIHINPPHSPYLPKKQFKKQFLNEDVLLTATDQVVAGINEKSFYPDKLQPTISKLRLRYDEFILEADNEFGLFINKIKTEGYLDTSIILVSADHGESFERGYFAHGGPTFYNNLIHIPLIIRTPKQKKAGVVLQPAEQVDLAPTILDLLDMDIPAWMEGESIRNSLENGTITDKPKFSMQLDENGVSGKIRRGVIAVIKDNYKYVYNMNGQKSELYNIVTDPQERTNLAETETKRAGAMKNLITQKITQENNKE